MNNIDPNCDTSCCVRHNHTRTGGSLNVVSVYALTRATRDNLVNGLTSLPLPPSSGLDMGTWLMGCPAQDSGGAGAPPDPPRSVILLLGCDSKRSNKGFCCERSERATPYNGAPPGVPAVPQAFRGRVGRVRLAAVGVWGLAPMKRRELRSSPSQAPAATTFLGPVSPGWAPSSSPGINLWTESWWC